MIRSMTGFGEASCHLNGTHFFLEVRSLNGKYFKASIRLPDELQGLEAVLEAELRRRLTRGTVTAVGKYSDSSATAAFRINQEALSNYIEQMQRIPHVANGSCQVDIGSLLELPGVLQPPSDEEERYDKARGAFMGLLDEACPALISMREREGALLVADLVSHLDLIEQHLNTVAKRAPIVVDEYQRRLRARIESLLKDAPVRVEPTDLIREVAVYAEKSDISEEIARLIGHVHQFRSLLNESRGQPVGRTLDFLAQEMLREANTIASKSGDVEISRSTVEIKGAIDRIKEQVQNVE